MLPDSFGVDRLPTNEHDLRVLAAEGHAEFHHAGDLLPKRTQRVQWMQRVMSVETSGPRSLLNTTRFSSW
jgi:hypothetical protein